MRGEGNKAPGELDSVGAKLWRAVFDEIGSEFIEVNSATVLLLCKEYQDYVKYSKFDPIARTPNGYETISASSQIANRCQANYLKLLRSLGLTRVQLTKGQDGEKDEDEFEQFANGD